MGLATEAAQQAASDAKNAVSDKKLPMAWRAPMIELREAARALKHKEMLQLAAAVVEEVPQKQTKTKWDRITRTLPACYNHHTYHSGAS